ncbi:DUF6415 family natural product biosynthesis protein [Streptomyces nodosus]
MNLGPASPIWTNCCTSRIDAAWWPGCRPAQATRQHQLPARGGAQRPSPWRTYLSAPGHLLCFLNRPQSRTVEVAMTTRPQAPAQGATAGSWTEASELLAVDAERMRRDWSEALELTSRMPLSVPPRDRVDPLTVRLRKHVGCLVPEVEAAIAAACHDTTDRETARWLLARVRTTLDQGPGPGDRTAAVHVEDLALSCRALSVICYPL